MSLTIDLSELKKLRADLQKVSDRAKDKSALLNDAGKYMVNTEVPLVFREHGVADDPNSNWPWPISRRGGQTLKDTGALAASVVYIVEGHTLTVGSNLPYAHIHQEGGTITPKKAKFLAIPDDRLSRAEKRNFDLRAWTNTWVKPSGSGYTVYQRGARDQVRVIAHLVLSVDIPQRKFLYFGLRALDAITTRWNKRIWGR